MDFNRFLDPGLGRLRAFASDGGQLHNQEMTIMQYLM
jgi:hypothetical protein